MPSRLVSPCRRCGRAGSCGCRRAHDRARGSATARGYGRPWQAIRAEHLAMERWCRCGCGQPATDVDHIVPRAAGGGDDHDNLQSLAHGHHSQETATVDGGFGNPPRGNTAGRIAVDHRAPEHPICHRAASSRSRDAVRVLSETGANQPRGADPAGRPRHGLLVRSSSHGSRDQLMKNPLLAVLRDHATLVRSFASDLGLTPTARTSVHAAPQRNDDGMTALLTPRRRSG